MEKRRRRSLCRKRRQVASACEDHRDLVPNQPGGNRGQLVIVIFRPAVFDPHVFSLDKAQFAQTSPKRRQNIRYGIARLGAEKSDHRHGLLRVRNRRPRRSSSDQRNERAPQELRKLGAWLAQVEADGSELPGCVLAAKLMFFMEALRQGAQVEAVELPALDSLRDEVSYAIGALENGRNKENADAYLAFLASSAAQDAYAKFGFVKARPEELILKPID
jgi:Bacterial extracellular solute-binding protein